MAIKGRSTVYNSITSKEKLEQVNPDNLELQEEFLRHLDTTDHSPSTIYQYKNVLEIFWCWNLEKNNNKSFFQLKKKEVANFQNHALNIWGWSPSRISFAKSTMKSLERYIVKMLDDDYPDYKTIWDKVDTPVKEQVREKAVFTDEELQSLLDKLIENKEYQKACVLALIIFGGRRKAEIPRFKVSYFDEANLICNGALYKTPEKIKTKGRGKRGKMLHCYTLAKQFKPYLDMWLKYREEKGITSEWLFPKFENDNWINEPMPTSTIDSYARTYSRLAGKHWYPHCGRHRATTRFVEAGIPANVIKDIFGWSDVSLVDVYSDIEAEDTFDKYFGAEGIKKVEKKGLEDL